MHTSTLALTSLALASFSLVACSAGNEDQANIDTGTAALLADNDAAAALEQDLEGSLEQPLSGADAEDAPVDTTSGIDAADAAASNAGAYFRPAGCVTSVRVANVVTHTFSDCTGPRGRVLNGTVVSTWSAADDGVRVEHVTQGFQIGGATIDHSVTLEYGYQNGVYTWTRTGSSTGATADGLPIVHSADYTSVFDAATGCITRDGQAETSLEGREFSRTIAGYERCGVGAFGCPSAGSFTLDRPRLHVELEFTGGGLYDLVVNDRSFEDRRLLWCIAN